MCYACHTLLLRQWCSLFHENGTAPTLRGVHRKTGPLAIVCPALCVLAQRQYTWVQDKERAAVFCALRSYFLLLFFHGFNATARSKMRGRRISYTSPVWLVFIGAHPLTMHRAALRKRHRHQSERVFNPAPSLPPAAFTNTSAAQDDGSAIWQRIPSSHSHLVTGPHSMQAFEMKNTTRPVFAFRNLVSYGCDVSHRTCVLSVCEGWTLGRIASHRH